MTDTDTAEVETTPRSLPPTTFAPFTTEQLEAEIATMTGLLPGTVVMLDEIAATTGHPWIGYLTDPTTPRAVRVWRGKLDTRAEFTADQILDTRTPTADELMRTAMDITAAITRERNATARVHIARYVAQFEELATLRRQAEHDEARERQTPQVAEFNEGLAQWRNERAARQANAAYNPNARYQTAGDT